MMPFASSALSQKPVIVVRHSLKKLVVLPVPAAFFSLSESIGVVSHSSIGSLISCLFIIVFFWLHMKSRGLSERLQKSISNNNLYLFSRILERIFEFPFLLLLGLWISYFLLDLVSRLVLHIHINPLETASHLVFGFVFSYILFEYLFPRIFIGGRWVSGLVGIFFVVAILTILKFQIIFYPQAFWEVQFQSFWLEGLRIVQFQFFTFTVWIFYANYFIQKEKVAKDVALQRLTIEHKSLQLSPHFMLNLFSALLIQVRNNSPNLYQDLENFSVMLKYGYKSLSIKNSLLDELMAIESYSKCQYLRFGEKLQMKLKLNYGSEKAGKVFLPKMILLTLVENIFKHGVFLKPKTPCIINCNLGRESFDEPLIFSFMIFNLVDVNRDFPESGFGMESVIKILKYNFGDQFCFIYSLVEGEFSLLLSVDYGQNI